MQIAVQICHLRCRCELAKSLSDRDVVHIDHTLVITLRNAKLIARMPEAANFAKHITRCHPSDS